MLNIPGAYRKVCGNSISTLGQSAYLEWDCDIGNDFTEEVPLRPLTSLKWPYLPEESAYPDPLKRDDPKALQTAQYEAIGSAKFFSFILSGSL